MNPFLSGNSRPKRSTRNNGENAESNDTAKPKSTKKGKKPRRKVYKLPPEVRERRKENERKRRAKIRANPKKREEYLEKERARKRRAVEEGKIKRVENMNPREVRIQRKKIRERVQKHRLRKRQAECSLENTERDDANAVLEATRQGTLECTPMQSTQERNNVILKESRQKILGEKLRARYRAERAKMLKKHAEELKKMKREVWKLKKASLRQNKEVKSPQLTPKSAVKKLCQKQNISSPVRRKLFEGFVLRAEVQASFKSISSYKEKQIMYRLVSGRILKNYRQLESVKGLFSLKQMRQARKVNKTECNNLEYVRKKSKNSDRNKEAVHNFFISNEASTECPGKKQGRLYDGQQRQRRYLNDDLKQLHKLFLSKINWYISYRTFCKYKPAWVVKKKLSARDTCLCKTCENIKYLFKASKSNGMLGVETLNDLTKSLCCNEVTTQCLLRQCKNCVSRTIDYLSVNENKPSMYEEWVTCTEERYNTKTKKKFSLTITKKLTKYCTVAELKNLFEVKLFPYMQHIGRFRHQTKAFESVIHSLKLNEMALLIDWSMNYVCKYGEELQSVHFGGSHAQIALHTGRVYMTEGRSASFCTMSENTRHDPKAIIAHLEPVLTKYLSSNPGVNTLFFLSDGPVTQYRNRDLYVSVTQHLTEIFSQIIRIEWIFSEAMHGKGEADGVGGTSKRTADRAVANGQDVNSLEKLSALLSNRCPSIWYHIISTDDIEKIDAVCIPKTTVIKGSLQIHQWIWTKEKKLEIVFKTLMCLACSEACSHFNLGAGAWLIPTAAASKPKKRKSGRRK